MSITPVLFSLGANLGDRAATLDRATALLTERILRNVRVSSLYETDPVGYLDQPMFLNMCVVGTCDLSAVDIRAAIRDIEKECGRRERPRWHEREIDIDILLYGESIIDEDDLFVPHPRMHERRFVLVPAVEIAPGSVHPQLNESLRALLDRCGDASDVRLWRQATPENT